MLMNNLIKNIEVEINSLKKESYYIQVRIKELEDALKVVQDAGQKV